DRYATAKLVADEAIELLGEGYAGEAFLATGLGYADALAAAPIMYAQGMPLVLADGAGAYTLSAGMDSFYVLGGTGAVPASVDDDAEYAGRLSGASRYETAIAVANFGVDDYGMSWNDLGIATGEGFADALAAGPLLGSKNSVLLMTQGTVLTPATEAKLLALAGDVDTYYVFGGTGVINAAVRADVQAALTPAPEPVGAHALPDVFCTGAGCHDSQWAPDIAMLHVDLADGQVGCDYCHGATGEPSRDCVGCHSGENAAHEGSHPVVPSEQGCTQSGCHAAGVVAIHADCTICHNPTTDVTDATCETCHGPAAEQHAGIPAHMVGGTAGGCFDAECHGTDVTRMHGTDFRLSGEEPPGCAACHAEGVTPSTTCLGACHPSANFGTWHDSRLGHGTLESSIAVSSQGCVSCHGSDLFAVTAEGHAGCSCHGAARGAGSTSCEGCHTDPMDPLAQYPYHVDAHAAWEQTARGTQSGQCVNCHGPQLVAIRPAFGFEFKADHGGCVCHYYDTLFTESYQPIGATTAEATECLSCHGGVFDPHGGVFVGGR
ncbi:MAG: cell wall-binding repeat-containing protein, partial [Coriobacteriia bacterium]|nr:cell wall-binding repeat-containing protein [Coriobacteriia bacterium]